MAVGCDDFLRKPFQEEVLLEMLGRHLGLQYELEAPVDERGDHADAVARLATLPEGMRARLQKALARLDVSAVEEALRELHAHDAQAAATLAPVIENFEYERAQALLGGLQ